MERNNQKVKEYFKELEAKIIRPKFADLRRVPDEDLIKYNDPELVKSYLFMKKQFEIVLNEGAAKQKQ